MNSFLNILFNTKATFEFLDDKFEDDLDVNNNIIFILYGLVIATDSFFNDNIAGLGLIWIILTFLIGAGAGLIFGKFILSSFIFRIGKLLKGKAEIIDIRVVVAYSLIPRILGLPFILYFGLTGKYEHFSEFGYYFNLGLNIIFSLLTLKILFQGIVKFNDFGYNRAILNLSPLILFGITIFLITYLK